MAKSERWWLYQLVGFAGKVMRITSRNLSHWTISIINSASKHWKVSALVIATCFMGCGECMAMGASSLITQDDQSSNILISAFAITACCTFLLFSCAKCCKFKSKKKEYDQLEEQKALESQLDETFKTKKKEDDQLEEQKALESQLDETSRNKNIEIERLTNEVKSKKKEDDQLEEQKDLESQLDETRCDKNIEIERVTTEVPCLLVVDDVRSAATQVAESLLKEVQQKLKEKKFKLSLTKTSFGDPLDPQTERMSSKIRIFLCVDMGRLKWTIKRTFLDGPLSVADVKPNDILMTMHPIHHARISDRMPSTCAQLPDELAEKAIETVDIRGWKGRLYTHPDNDKAVNRLADLLAHSQDM